VRGFKEQAYRMPMSKKQLEKKQQAKKAELAELQKQADAGDGEAKKKIAKLKKKMK
jgi:ribosomal protein L29